jgi:dolichol-phosphate mannosyltransferase
VIVQHLREINDPYPYVRGLICELGYPISTINFEQPRRLRGISKNNFYTLYDLAMLGIVSHSMVPLRIAGMLGAVIGCLSVATGLYYAVMKAIYWYSFPVGIAPLVIGIFFMFGLLFLFVGLLGEYIGSIHTYVKKRPVVVERERINF